MLPTCSAAVQLDHAVAVSGAYATVYVCVAAYIATILWICITLVYAFKASKVKAQYRSCWGATYKLFAWHESLCTYHQYMHTVSITINYCDLSFCASPEYLQSCKNE